MEQVSDFFTLYKNFAWEKDSESMIKLYDNHVVIFDMWNKGHYSGLTEWSGIIKQWLGSLKDERVNVIFEMTEIHRDETAGFASSLIKYQAVSTGNKILRSMTNRITLGFKKTEDSWKVVHQHTSAPINSDLQAIFTE
ncbi:nuclear transport factor 2 family protein [Rubrolithibacter danxiaensis]|uniref:nuclear transport factor 2 family protein n=1 Tax=Rubrolithibacter danxiaensis TaxID=3390805 RepID=UPI003BF86CB8